MECLFTTGATSVRSDVWIRYNDLEEPLEFSNLPNITPCEVQFSLKVLDIFLKE